MVQGDSQHKVIRSQLIERAAQQRALLKRKRLLHFAKDQCLATGQLFGTGQMTQINNGQIDGEWVGDALHRLPIDGGKGGAQTFLPLHHGVEAFMQRRLIQCPMQPQHSRDDIPIACAFQLIDKPNPLLGKGEWQIAIARERQK